MGQLSTQPPTSDAPIDPILESNHRVANNLSAIAATLRHKIRALESGPELIPRQEFAACLEEVTGKIIAIARLYRSFADYTLSDDHDAHEVLAKVLGELERSGIFGERLRIGALSPAHACRIDATQAFRLTLAFSEIVTNAVKYAHPAGLPVEISIASRATIDGGFVLQVSDDGVGLPDGFEESRDGGTGLKLTRALVESAGAKLDVTSDPLGLTYSMRFASA